MGRFSGSGPVGPGHDQEWRVMRLSKDCITIKLSGRRLTCPPKPGRIFDSASGEGGRFAPTLMTGMNFDEYCNN